MEDETHAFLEKFSKDAKVLRDFQKFYLQTLRVLELCENMMKSDVRAVEILKVQKQNEHVFLTLFDQHAMLPRIAGLDDKESLQRRFAGESFYNFAALCPCSGIFFSAMLCA
jgi:hypothetical protein